MKTGRAIGKKALVLLGYLLLVPSLANAQQVEYYHLDALGSVRAVTDEQGDVIERHDYLPYGEEWNAAPSNNSKKFTGKERDEETGFDYFGARYYESQLARFTTIDPALTFADNRVDPQRWNRYAYVRNNPLRYVDPDGKILETPWDIFNITLGLASLGANVAVGNVGGAAADAVGLAIDVAAAVVPGVPGGAGSALRAMRGADKARDLIAINRASGKAAEVKVAAELVAEGKTILGQQVCCRTSQGRRFIDVLTKDKVGSVAAVEVKSGNATRSVLQRTKDAEIAVGRGTFVGKNSPPALKGRNLTVETIERKPK